MEEERKRNIEQLGKTGLLAYITHLMILKPVYFLKGSAPYWPTPTARGIPTAQPREAGAAGSTAPALCWPFLSQQENFRLTCVRSNVPNLASCIHVQIQVIFLLG